MEKEIKKIMAQLQEPFAENQLEWRVQQGDWKDGKPWAIILAYVNNRSIQARLDEVFGIGGWWNEYDKGPEGGVICGLTCVIDGTPITKWDGSQNTDIEPIKGGLSDSMKRAAVQWGIGRYLYNLPATFAIFPENGKGSIRAKIKNKWTRFNPPMLPDWAKSNSEKGDPIQWAHSIPEISKICKDMGMMHSDVADAVFAGNFDVEKVKKYLNELQDAKFEEEKK